MGLRLKDRYRLSYWKAHGHIRWKCFRDWAILSLKNELQKLRKEGYDV